MVLASVVLLGLATTASATDAQSTAAASPDSSSGLQEIIVTAEKRSANLQDVPVAVSAITANELATRGLAGTEALTAAVPGLVITNPANVGNPYLRGVGSALFDPSGEQSVALYVDGVYIAAPESNLFSFNNIKDVEVLKGPQGTLFGRNATGGVIQISTRDPSHTPSADVSVGYGNYDDVTASAYVTTGITKDAAGDLAVLYENQGRGYGRDLTTGAPTFRQAIGNYALRSKLLLTPTDTTTLVGSVDYSHSVSTSAYQKPPGVFSPIDGSTYPGRYNALGDLNDRNTIDTGGASLRIDQGLGSTTLTSITAYRRTVVTYNLDDDVTAIPAADITLFPRAHNISQELQLAGAPGGWLEWLVGGYYFDAKGEYSPVVVDGFEQVADSQKTRSYAGFGQATATVLTHTDLTLGARYTTEKQDYALTFPATLGLSRSFNKLTYRVAVDQHLTQDLLGYVSYNRGFKSGGFNLLAPGNSFEPEVLDAYEAGLKAELLDRRLRLNTAAFFYNYQNIQLDIPVFAGNVIANAARAHIKGLESDFEFVPVDNLTVSGGISLLDGHYSSLPDGVPLDQNGVAQPPRSESGKHTVITPPFSGTLSVDYRFHTDLGLIRPSVTLVYNDGFYWQTDNRLTQPAYTLLNTSLTWSSPNSRYDVSLWGKNVTDARYYIARVTVARIGDAQEQAPPETYGVTFTAHF